MRPFMMPIVAGVAFCHRKRNKRENKHDGRSGRTCDTNDEVYLLPNRLFNPLRRFQIMRIRHAVRDDGRLKGDNGSIALQGISNGRMHVDELTKVGRVVVRATKRSEPVDDVYQRYMNLYYPLQRLQDVHD